MRKTGVEHISNKRFQRSQKGEEQKELGGHKELSDFVVGVRPRRILAEEIPLKT